MATRATELANQLTARGLPAHPFGADVRDEAAVTRLVHEVEAALGPIEILVLNATGHQPMLAIEDQTWQSYLDQLEFFVKSPLLLTQAVLPGMRSRRFGRIIQIGSEVVELGNPRFAKLRRSQGRATRPDALVGPRTRPRQHHRQPRCARLDSHRALPRRH